MCVCSICPTGDLGFCTSVYNDWSQFNILFKIIKKGFILFLIINHFLITNQISKLVTLMRS